MDEDEVTPQNTDTDKELYNSLFLVYSLESSELEKENEITEDGGESFCYTFDYR